MEALNAIIYTLILIAFIVCSIITWIQRGNSSCKGTAYGKMALALSVVNFIFGFLMLVLHQALYHMYPGKNKRLPTWLVGSIVEKNHKDAQVRPIDGSVSEHDKLVDVSTVLKDQIAKYDTNEEFKEEVKMTTKLLVILFISRSSPESMKFAPQFAKI